MKRWQKVILAFLLALGAAAYWLLYDNRPGDVPPARLDIAELRIAANSIAGPKPDPVSYTHLRAHETM
jgi:hypothetical protein